jgi:hypothetical protein
MSLVIRAGGREWRGIHSVVIDDLEIHSSLLLVMENGAAGFIGQTTGGDFMIDVGTGTEYVPYVYGQKVVITAEGLDE